MMGRTPCCNVDGLKKGAWTSEEDQKLIAYIQEHGEGGWRTLPQKAGLQRCGKSCRLRWANYLRPDIKRGEFSPEEEDRIIELHASLGNRWSAIARHLPRRTDNEIKNYWNTHLKKRLFEKGIHPTTHKPISPTAGSSSSSDDAVPSLSGNKTPTAPPPAGQEQPQLVPAQAHVSSSSSFSASASASAQLLNKLAAKLAPPPHASSRFSAEQDDEVEEGANGVVEDDARTKPRRRPASSSSSAKLLNKMASRLAHPLHCLNTLKSILSSAAASDRTNLMMHRSASASSLSESTAATTSISTSNNDVPAQTASSKPDQLAFLESLDLDVLNDWHDPQQYDPLIMDFLADSITSKEKQDQPYHYYEEDSSLLPSLYGSHALHSPAYFHDAFRAPAEDEHNFMDFDGPSTSASRNNNDPADDPHCGGGYVVDNQVAADDAYGHHQFEYQHGAGGLLDGDDEHGRTLFNHYGDFRVDAASFF